MSAGRCANLDSFLTPFDRCLPWYVSVNPVSSASPDSRFVYPFWYHALQVPLVHNPYPHEGHFIVQITIPLDSAPWFMDPHSCPVQGPVVESPAKAGPIGEWRGLVGAVLWVRDPYNYMWIVHGGAAVKSWIFELLAVHCTFPLIITFSFTISR